MDNAQLGALEQLRREADARIAAKASGVGSNASKTENEQPSGVSQAEPLPTQASEVHGLAIDWSTEPPPTYANGMQLACSPQEFALLFTEMTRFPGRLAPENRNGSERARVAASLRVHPDAFFQMLCVMTSSWNRFITEAVDARMRQPKFKLLDAGEHQLEGLSEKQRGEV